MAKFAKKIINVKFALDSAAGTFDPGTGLSNPPNTFNKTGSNVVELTGLRAECAVVYNSGNSFGELDLKVYGVPLPIINALTIVQNAFNANVHNSIEVSAGDAVNGVAVVFNGGIQECWADAGGAPEVSLVVKAYTSLSSAFTTTPPVSYKGAADVGTIASGIAQRLVPPLKLENSGVSGRTRDHYAHGSARDQLVRLADESHFEYFIDQTNGVLAIWPRGQARGTAVVEVSGKTDLVGYPSFTQKGIMLTTLFNPNIAVGGAINVNSIFTPANGSWTPVTIGHDIESETPGGKWFTHLECTVFGRDSPYDPQQ